MGMGRVGERQLATDRSERTKSVTGATYACTRSRTGKLHLRMRRGQARMGLASPR